MPVVHYGAFIDAVQTAGIVVISGALIYVVVRLDREIRRWANTLTDVNKQLKEQAALGEAVARAWERIEKLEARLDAIERNRPSA